jgi:large subunit ribosomal protein L1
MAVKKILNESKMPLSNAIRVAYALSVGHKLPISVNIRCKPSDSSSKDIRGFALLPHSFLKTKTLVFAKGEKANDARKSGAYIVGGEELIEKIVDGFRDYDRVICTNDMKIHVMKLARILGPLGLMPTEKKGTLTDDVSGALKNQADTVLFKADHNGYLSAIVSDTCLTKSQTEENIRLYLKEVKDSKQGKKDKEFVETVAVEVKNYKEIHLSPKEFEI